MIEFIAGAFVGGIIGVMFMALFIGGSGRHDK